MIDAQAVLDAIDREIWPRVATNDFEKTEFGPGYDCCGCSTYGDIVHDIEAIIRRLAGIPD